MRAETKFVVFIASTWALSFAVLEGIRFVEGIYPDFFSQHSQELKITILAVLSICSLFVSIKVSKNFFK